MKMARPHVLHDGVTAGWCGVAAAGDPRRVSPFPSCVYGSVDAEEGAAVMTPKSSFACVLKEKDSALFDRLQDMKRRAMEEWVHLLIPDMGSHSGYIHLHNVERNADKMIPVSAKHEFSAGEIFLLLTSILLHDLGRIIPDEIHHDCPVIAKEEYEGSREYYALRTTHARHPLPVNLHLCPVFGQSQRTAHKNPPLAAERCPYSPPHATYPDTHCRLGRQKQHSTHHCLSRRIVQDWWAILGMPDEHISFYCSLLTFWHGLRTPPVSDDSPCHQVEATRPFFSETSLEPYGRLRLPLLAAILRIADETENCWTRALRQHWYVRIRQKGAALPKAFRRFIEDVEFCHEAQCIIMHTPESFEVEEWNRFQSGLTSTWKSTQAVLFDWADLLASVNGAFRHVFIERAGRFQKLLGGDDPLGPRFVTADLSDVFESDGASSFLPKGTLANYDRAIQRLLRGTLGYEEYSWSSIAAAIGEPIDAKGIWVIQQMKKDRGVGFEVYPGSTPGTVKICPRPIANHASNAIGRS